MHAHFSDFYNVPPSVSACRMPHSFSLLLIWCMSDVVIFTLPHLSLNDRCISRLRPFLADIVFAYVRAPPYAYTMIYCPCSAFFRRRWKKSTAIGKDRRRIFSSALIFLFVWRWKFIHIQKCTLWYCKEGDHCVCVWVCTCICLTSCKCRWHVGNMS